MLSALIKGINQLSDKATRKYVWFSVFAALITFVILWSVVAWLLAQTSITQIGWLESVIDVLGGVATLALTWFLFPATVSAVIGLFLDQVAECVEKNPLSQAWATQRSAHQRSHCDIGQIPWHPDRLEHFAAAVFVFRAVISDNVLSGERLFAWSRIFRNGWRAAFAGCRCHKLEKSSRVERADDRGRNCIFIDDTGGQLVDACCRDRCNGAPFREVAASGQRSR